jgi:parallel beta-helix repeat protein
MKKLLCLLPVMISFSVFSQLKDTVAFKITKLNNRVFKNLRISNSSGHGIQLSGCTNITIENCTVVNSVGNGIDGFSTSGVTIRNCVFENNQTGIYLSTCTKVVVENNNFKNAQGPYPRGQAVQFNAVTGAGNKIACSYIINELGRSNAEDAINL